MTLSRWILTFAFAASLPTLSSAQQAPEATNACAESWTKVDTDENGVISKQEASRASDAEFRRIDTDGNGKISVKEWKSCATPAVDEAATAPSQDGTSQDQAAWEGNRFGRSDKDKSGELSAKEAADADMAAETGQNQNHADQAQQAMKGASRFSVIDVDGNGKISSSEWKNREDANIERRFTVLDQDGNGTLSQDEFQQYRSKRYNEAQKAQQASDGTSDPTVWYFYYYVL